MTIKNKIRKRINSWNIISKEPITYVKITKEEATELGEDVKEIDGVKLVVVDELGEKPEKEDCFAYLKNICYALDGMYCANSKCKFYRNDITIEKIEKGIKKYSEKMGGNDDKG